MNRHPKATRWALAFRTFTIIFLLGFASTEIFMAASFSARFMPRPSAYFLLSAHPPDLIPPRNTGPDPGAGSVRIRAGWRRLLDPFLSKRITSIASVLALAVAGCAFVEVVICYAIFAGASEAVAE